MGNAFELKPPEICMPLVVREGGQEFRFVHAFRAPTFQDWLAYESRIRFSVETVDGAQKSDHDREEAIGELWAEIIIRVEGYTFPPEDWKARVPYAHKEEMINRFASIETSEPGRDQDAAFDAERQTVFLSARRDGVKYKHLQHILRRPDAREKKEWRRIHDSAMQVRGSRADKTLLPSRLRDEARMYDQMLVEVYGYTVGGNPASRQDAIAWMDAQHKKKAMLILFNPDIGEE